MGAAKRPLHAAPPVFPGLVAALLVFSCGPRPHIEPTLPTPTPTAAPSGSAAAEAPPPAGTGHAILAPSSGATEVPPGGGPACAGGARSPLGAAACGLVAALGPTAREAVFAAGPVSSTASLPRAADLSTHIAELLAHEAGRGARVVAAGADLERARMAAGKARTLVYVSSELAGGRLRILARSYPTAAEQWKSGAPSPLASAEVRFALGGELGPYLPRVALAASRIERDTAPTDVAALACGDVLGDGSTELLAVGRRKVQIGRAGDGRFTSRVETAWATLSSIAPSPLREPIATAAIVPGGVLAGVTDRAEGFRLSTSLAKVQSLGGMLPLGDGFGCTARSGVGLSAPRPCEAAPSKAAEGPALDAFATTTAFDAHGAATRLVATHAVATREITVRVEGATEGPSVVTVPNAGSALALGDLDLDGRPELLTSLSTDDPASDAVVVSTWSKDGSAEERLRIPVKDGVRAIAVCPPEDLRMAPIAVATTGGIWIVR